MMESADGKREGRSGREEMVEGRSRRGAKKSTKSTKSRSEEVVKTMMQRCKICTKKTMNC